MSVWIVSIPVATGEERKLQVRKVNVFQLRMSVAADVGVSYITKWLAFHLLPTVIFV